ncbi:MAG: cytoskeletal protein CcmA (bactofilin family) [Parvicellaceae bacterium]|jgi:cytoskeletal protein CcmA (bactofilin family)
MVMAQTQSNEINSTGMVGIGTTTPTKELEVNGETRLNGKVKIIDDTEIEENLKVKKKVFVEQDLKVTGDAAFQSDVKIHDELKVIGETKLEGNAKLQQDVQIAGELKLESLNAPAGAEVPLSVDENGVVKKADKSAHLHFLYEPDPVALFCAKYGPRWVSETDAGGNSGIIYTELPCNTRVGIGTKDVKIGYKLGVHGKIICEEVEVKLKANWPDYVFEENYELMPLDSVSKFINEKKHLPGVPSSKSIEEKEAVGLGEMNRILLEKVEELFLHSIKMNEEVQRLNLEIELLKQKVAE